MWIIPRCVHVLCWLVAVSVSVGIEVGVMGGRGCVTCVGCAPLSSMNVPSCSLSTFGFPSCKWGDVLACMSGAFVGSGCWQG